MISTPSHPSVGTARKGRGRETPARSTELGRGHRAGGLTPVEQDTGPAVKTSNPRLSPRDAQRAVGGIRAWGRIPAAGPAHLRLYSHSRRLRARTAIHLRGPLRGHRRTPAPARSTVGTRPLPPASALAPARRDQTLGSDEQERCRLTTPSLRSSGLRRCGVCAARARSPLPQVLYLLRERDVSCPALPPGG